MKKIFLTLLTFSLISVSYGQAFHFVNTQYTLVKNTDQSPAHWYLEIYNDVGVDTTLRWKTTFSNVPAVWNISFDNQDIYYATILDGDSADFTCFSGLAFPQKLIIGATLNDTPANCSVYFDIYDPENLSFVQEIEFRFMVTQGTAGVDELNNENWVIKKGETYIFNESVLGEEIRIYTQSGQLIYEGEVEKEMSFDVGNSQVLMIQLSTIKGSSTKNFYQE